MQEAVKLTVSNGDLSETKPKFANSLPNGMVVAVALSTAILYGGTKPINLLPRENGAFISSTQLYGHVQRNLSKSLSNSAKTSPASYVILDPIDVSALGVKKEMTQMDKQISFAFRSVITLLSVIAAISALSSVGFGFLPTPIDTALFWSSTAGVLGFAIDNWKRQKFRQASKHA